ncbi:MAG: replicative DNA helicase [Candidatus Vogelbacteria bacterium RIFOXYD1_FULL_46_19]|uniref:Replicative DNA helicase n=1 Tax=Candidatus Vogelbacteria bacterium RIFOXYD1_FULL_46_19 TaxID=1802439 RepID=A0A1G2QGF2_9BACT|nr:MAG: replicative DNA helicase [Candidatus Vogelbacteria bacterium RIFOXYD1_FULL_46_19]
MAEATKNFVKSPLKIPPQDISSEQALLGSVMIKPDSLHEILDTIYADTFYANKHRIIFKGMVELHDKNEPIDVVTLTSHLKNKKLLEQIGGSSYLAELISLVPSAANIAHYAETVAKKFALRNLIDSADRILELGYNESEDIDTVFDKAEQLIFNLGTFSKKTYIALKDTLTDAWERFDKLHKSKDGHRGVPSGFRDLDNLLSGFQKSDLIILAARPSVGKTSLALDIVRNVACRQNLPVAIFSLEMSTQQLVDRIIAAESRVDSWKLRTGRVSAQEDFDRIRDALDQLSKAPIFIDDEPSNNITKMKTVARRLKSEHGLALIVVDYLQLMVPRRESDSMVQMVTEISRSLKGLARELEVPVIALSQLSRAVEQRGGKPRLSDLRDSGSIEQDADVVMFIHREDRFDESSERKNIAEILVEKHRNGPVGKIDLYFDEHRVSFNTVEKGDFGSF